MNCELFIDSYLNKISEKFNITRDEAFEVFSVSAVLELSFDEVYNNVLIKSKEDGGIDGIYYSEDYGSITMHVFQCKNSKKISQNDIEKFRNDYKEIFVEGDKYNKHNISGLKYNIEKFKTKSFSGKLIETVLYFIYNGKYDDKKYESNRKLTDNYHINDDYEIWDSEKLYQKIRSLVKSLNKRNPVDFVFEPINSNITSSKDNQGLISFSIYQVKAAIFRIPAIQICELLENEEKINGSFEKIFAENIRGFLGKKNPTNAKIVETINSDKKIYFPFLNNGITIICDEFVLPYQPSLGRYRLKTKNPVIVNGLQTTYLLYLEYKRQKGVLDDVYITIKLYETDDPELVELITDATNTQSAIGFLDKISNKKFNVYAKELFENKGIGYVTKRGELFVSNEDKLKYTIDNKTILLLWYSSFFESPDISISSPKIVYEEIFQATNKQSHRLHSVFKGEIESPLYSQLFLIYAIIYLFKKEHELNKETIEDSLSDKFDAIAFWGQEYLVYFIYKLIEDKLDVISNEIIIKAIYELVGIIRPSFTDPSKYINKSEFVGAILNNMDYFTSKFILKDFHSSRRTYENYIEIFDVSETPKELSLKLASLHINIENIKLNI